MKLVGKVTVEPLDDERLTNIERNLVVRVAELSQQRTAMRAPRRLLAVAAVAMAIVVAGIVGWRVRGDGTPMIEAPPERIAMHAGTLDLGDAQIAGRDFTVTRSASRVEVAMQPGTLELTVEHRPERLFVVKAGDVEIEDVGTRFSVAYDGTNVEVRVTEGEVKVKHAGKELAVTAGNAWTIELGPISIAQLTASSQPTPQDTLVAATEPANIAPPAAGSATSAGSVGSASGAGGAGGAGSAGSANAGSASKPAKVRKSSARRALEEAALEPPDAAGTDEPRAAIAIYLDRVRTMPEGEDKARLLYSIAVMQHRAKQDRAALYTISGVLKRQGGPAYKAARWLDVRIRCLKAFDDDCRIAAQKYQATFEGWQAGVAQEILKEISRGQ